jgi:hypothetical protein
MSGRVAATGAIVLCCYWDLSAYQLQLRLLLLLLLLLVPVVCPLWAAAATRSWLAPHCCYWRIHCDPVG